MANNKNTKANNQAAAPKNNTNLKANNQASGPKNNTNLKANNQGAGPKNNTNLKANNQASGPKNNTNLKANNQGKNNLAKPINSIQPPKFDEALKELKVNDIPKVDAPPPITVDKLYNKIDNLKGKNTNLMIIIGVIILLIIIIIVVYYIYSRNDPVQNVKVYVEKQISTNKYTLDGDFVDLPKDGYDYSISFWLYIKDYYEEYTYWRHILHKGREPINKLIEHKSWKSLSQEFQEQSPGIWLHPNKNTIRLSFTTEITKDYCNSNFLENTCNDKTYCMWDGLTCKLKDEHAFTKEGTVDYENTDKKLIEYIDLENIPIKNMHFISFSFEQKVLNVYMNGKLYKTKKFLGTPVFNKEAIHFNLKNTFNGSIYKFRYVPLSLKSSDLLRYYKDIPNVKYFPKSLRLKTFAKKFKVKDFISTLLGS